LNKIHGEFDIPKLAELLASLPADLAAFTGFDDEAIKRVMAEADAAIAKFALENKDLDEAPDPPPEPVSREGDLVLLGRHRLLCGSARNLEDVRRLCDGASIECLWTDPPYGVSYVGGTKHALTITGDDGDGLAGLLRDAFSAVDTVLSPLARLYIAAPAGPQGTVFREAIRDAGWRLHQVLVWAKDALVLGHSDYHYRHEDLLYAHKPGEGRPGRGNHDGTRWYGGNAQDTVLEVPRPRRNEQHPTMKPVALVTRCLRNSTQPGDAVLDLFLGSGTTIVACEQLGLVGYGLEVDPRYVDVAVSRWEALTGQKAQRVRP
jgi:DNA modification methylase